MSCAEEGMGSPERLKRRVGLLVEEDGVEEDGIGGREEPSIHSSAGSPGSRCEKNRLRISSGVPSATLSSSPSLPFRPEPSTSEDEDDGRGGAGKSPSTFLGLLGSEWKTCTSWGVTSAKRRALRATFAFREGVLLRERMPRGGVVGPAERIRVRMRISLSGLRRHTRQGTELGRCDFKSGW